MFMTYETVFTRNRNNNAQGIECLLDKEADGLWLLV